MTAVSLVSPRYEEQRRPESFFQELADRIRSVPGGLALRVTRLAPVLRIWRRLQSGTEGRSSMIRHETKDFRAYADLRTGYRTLSRGDEWRAD